MAWGGMGWHGVAWGGMGWHGVASVTPWSTACQLFATPGTYFAIFYSCILIFVANEKSPEVLIDLNFGLCDLRESSFFSSTHFIHLIVIAQRMKYVL